MRNYSRILAVIFIGIMIAGCEGGIGYYYFPEYFADYMGLAETQREEVLPRLQEIQTEMIAYFREWMPVLRERERSPIISPDSSLQEAKTKVWQFMREKGKEIMPHLTPAQQGKFSEIELPDLELRELFRVQRNREFYVSKELKASRTIDTQREIGDGQLTKVKLQELQNSRTITIGFQRISGARIGDVSRGFPLFIQATMMDPVLRKAETMAGKAKTSVTPASAGKDDVLAVNLSLSTYYHESYLDLKRWIVYLELKNGLQVEPQNIIKRETAYLKETPNPFRNIFMMDDDVADTKNEQRTASATQRVVEEERQPGLGTKRAFYTLEFPLHPNGNELIGRERGELKLIFLNEVDGHERAEGSWKFE